eukprot:gnl/MRDRNA2_/MRDRNA2_131091_c0_seq1.p1 gnl/MRDRNA2_/MRDRNA2_131091_c0~~gnl/MRDRNA2_/MRDRNA2_131091_c0_seq1.p1  ORF type:complete len:1114 (+),score=165.32 gnl/MRDRNA2_/MRDRNA2_131091_c0_seq1:285-3626(+)
MSETRFHAIPQHDSLSTRSSLFDNEGSPLSPNGRDHNGFADGNSASIKSNKTVLCLLGLIVALLGIILGLLSNLIVLIGKSGDGGQAIPSSPPPNSMDTAAKDSSPAGAPKSDPALGSQGRGYVADLFAEPGSKLDSTSWKVDDILCPEIDFASTLAISRDGSLSAYTVTRNCGLGELWVRQSSPVSKIAPPSLLHKGKRSDFWPQFSPYGQWLLYWSDDQTVVLHGLAIQSRRELRLPKNTLDVRWVTETSLVVLAQPAPYVWQVTHRPGDDARVAEDATHPPIRLYLASVPQAPKDSLIATLDLEMITGNSDWIERAIPSPDGQFILGVAKTSRGDFKPSTVLRRWFLIGPVSISWSEKPLFEGRKELSQDLEVKWASDSTGFYIAGLAPGVAWQSQCPQYVLYFYDIKSSMVFLADMRGLFQGDSGASIAVLGNQVLLRLEDGAGMKLALLERSSSFKDNQLIDADDSNDTDTASGGWRTLWSSAYRENGVISSMVAPVTPRIGKGGEVPVVVIWSNATRPPEIQQRLCRADSCGFGLKLEGLNQPGGRGSKPYGRVEIIRFHGANGDDVEALLHYPLPVKGAKPPRPAPLVVAIHGGPCGQDSNWWWGGANWAYPLLLWRQYLGAYVLQVNYHGSSGYGQGFSDSVADGRYLTIELDDVRRGVEFVFNRYPFGIDRTAIAVVGWSNGAILGASLIAGGPGSDGIPIAAASLGAGDVEWLSDWGSSEFGAQFDNWYFGGLPLAARLALYLKDSSFFRLFNATVPTILFQGTQDTNVPAQQSIEAFRALTWGDGRPPARLVRFPGEGHSIVQYEHQRRKISEELRWLSKYLNRSITQAPKQQLSTRLSGSISPNSPLGAVAAVDASARDSRGLLGYSVSGRLVPEMVGIRLSSVPSLSQVARFEITQAQFSHFVSQQSASYSQPTCNVVCSNGNNGSDAFHGVQIGDFPAIATFSQAQGYATFLADVTGKPFRLPTAAEGVALTEWAGSNGNTLDRWVGSSVNADDATQIKEAILADGDAAAQRRLLRAAGASVEISPGIGDVGPGADGRIFDLDGNVAEWAVGTSSDSTEQGVAVGASAERPGWQSLNPYVYKSHPAFTGFRVVLGVGAI